MTKNDVIVHRGVTYRLPEHVQFVRDMLAAGIKVSYYHGRYFYFGPSAEGDDDMQHRIYRATEVKLQSDTRGYDRILYPTVTDLALEGQADDCDEEEEHDDE